LEEEEPALVAARRPVAHPLPAYLRWSADRLVPHHHRRWRPVARRRQSAAAPASARKPTSKSVESRRSRISHNMAWKQSPEWPGPRTSSLDLIASTGSASCGSFICCCPNSSSQSVS